MGTIAFISLSLIGYGLGAVLCLMAAPNLDDHDVIWWPLTLIKFLWRSFYRALTTGWRP